MPICAIEVRGMVEIITTAGIWNLVSILIWSVHNYIYIVGIICVICCVSIVVYKCGASKFCFSRCVVHGLQSRPSYKDVCIQLCAFFPYVYKSIMYLVFCIFCKLCKLWALSDILTKYEKSTFDCFISSAPDEL